MNKRAKRFFYKIDGQGHPIPGTLARFYKKPEQGRWVEVPKDICCPVENPCVFGSQAFQNEKIITINNTLDTVGIRLLIDNGFISPFSNCTGIEDTSEVTIALFGAPGDTPQIAFFDSNSCANYQTGTDIDVSLYAEGVLISGTLQSITTGDPLISWSEADWLAADEIRIEATP